jgi:hypothetical protein
MRELPSRSPQAMPPPLAASTPTPEHTRRLSPIPLPKLPPLKLQHPKLLLLLLLLLPWRRRNRPRVRRGRVVRWRRTKGRLLPARPRCSTRHPPARRACPTPRRRGPRGGLSPRARRTQGRTLARAGPETGRPPRGRAAGLHLRGRRPVLREACGPRAAQEATTRRSGAPPAHIG